jgi:hypothetical protein
MKGKNLPLTTTVKKITEMNLTGNVIPIRWYQELRTGKSRPRPAHAAIQILADIIYWYRAAEVRDETSGRLIGLRRKFAADQLQVSYRRYEDLLGYSKSVIKRAFDFLVESKLIHREFRIIRTTHGPVSNVMFVEPIPAKIKQISVIQGTPGSVYATPSKRIRKEGSSKYARTYTRDYTETSRESSVPLPSPQGGSSSDLRSSDHRRRMPGDSLVASGDEDEETMIRF